MRWIFIVALVVLIRGETHAQSDSLRAAIDAQVSEASYLDKGRSLLFEKIRNGRREEAIGIRKILMDRFDGEVLPFTPREYWLLLYWTSEAKEILRSAKDYQELDLLDFQRSHIYPPEDLFSQQLMLQSRNHADSLRSRVKKWQLSPGDELFLQLLLEDLLQTSGIEPSHSSAGKIQRLALDYIQQYPEHPLRPFVEQNIYRPQSYYGARARGFSSQMGFGSGFGWWSRQLAEEYRPVIPLDLQWGWNFNRWMFNMKFQAGFTKTAQDIELDDNTTWEKDSPARAYLGSLQSGYRVWEWKGVRLSPFLGAGGMAIEPPDGDIEDRPELERFKTGFTFAFSGGGYLKIPLGKRRGWNEGGNAYEQYSLQLGYTYTIPLFYTKIPELTGDYQNLSLSFVITY